jgi:tetratricopeptide (TPR) repeat protein
MAQLDVPMRFFYEEMLDESPAYDPCWLLEHYREGNSLPRDPFLAAVHDRLLTLIDRPILAGAMRRRRTEIAELEVKRCFDRDAAKNSLEGLCREVLENLEEARELRRGQLADCAHLVLIWAAIQRARGHRDDSCDAYRLGYRLASAGRDPKVLGTFYCYSSHLLIELGQACHALRFAERSCRIFQQLRDRDLHAQGLMQTAAALFELGRHGESRIQTIASLRTAPRRSWNVRFAAWLHLGNLAMERGQARKAWARIKRARVLSRGSGYMQAYTRWREAAALKRLGRLAEAARAFRDAIRLFESYGQSLDVAFVAVDLAEMLMAAGRFSETLTMARALTPCFEKLGSNAQALALWLDLLALILQGSKDSSLAHVVLLRNALRMADPRTRQPNKNS